MATCDFLGSVKGTRWVPSPVAVVAPGPPPTAPNFLVQMRNPALVVALWARALAPVWSSAVLRVAHNVKGDNALQKDGTPMPADVLWDEAGLRYLPEPIPLRSDEYVQVYVTNDDAVPRTVSVGAEVVELTGQELERYQSDPEYRAQVLEQIRAARRR